MAIIKEVLENMGVKIEGQFDGYYTINPSWRNGNSRAVLVNEKSGFFKDLVTEDKGNFKQLLSLILGRELTNDEVKNYKKIEEQLDFSEDVKMDLPMKYYKNDYMLLLPNYFYFEGRGISKETCKAFELGMSSGGSLYGRVVFPIKTKENKIIGYNGRDITNKPNRAKYKLWGNPSRNFIYPVHLADKYIRETKQVILVESAADCLFLYTNGIKNSLVLFGLNLSKAVLSYLISMNPNYIIIATNNDVNNQKNIGEAAADKIKFKLQRFFDENKIKVWLPGLKDFCPDNLNDVEIKKRQTDTFKAFLENLK